jgi:NTP pyrophosphatase (non-canonical NTP hydrolase)
MYDERVHLGCVIEHTPLDIINWVGENWNMDFKLYQEMSKRTMPVNSGKASKCNYSMGLAGESGEVVDYLKKVLFHGHPLDELKLKHEIGDVMHYLAGLCTMFGFTMEECATLNVIKLGERYPNGFSDADSIKRVDIKCDNCGGSGMVSIGEGIRGIMKCDKCNGKGVIK